MELRKILKVTWRRSWLIVLGSLVAATAVFVASVNVEPVYQAKATLMVNQSSTSPFLNYSSLMTGQDLALTYAELLRSRPLLEMVIAKLNLDLSYDELVEDVLTIRLVRETGLLELTVEDTDPQRASDTANEIVYTFLGLHNRERQLESIIALEDDLVVQMAKLGQLIEDNRVEADRLSSSSAFLTEEERNRIQTALSSQLQTYARLLEVYLSIQLAKTELLDLTVVEPAVPPAEPVRPRVAVYTVLAAAAGLTVSTGLAFLVNYLDRSFEDSDRVQEILSLPTFGTIPKFQGRERASGVVTVDMPHSPVSEAYRVLRTNIRFASIDEPLKTLLVTSAEVGEGKTSVTANLGIVCAHAGLRVVLVDTDLRLPGLHEVFGFAPLPGLADLLVGGVQRVQDCMRRTRAGDLHLVPSGSVPPNPSELLGSRKMRSILDEVKATADLVVIDTPPVLAVTDACVLADQVDGVILVVEAERTSHEAARRACEALESAGANILGVVLTKARIQRRRTAYHYYTSGERSTRSPASETISEPNGPLPSQEPAPRLGQGR